MVATLYWLSVFVALTFLGAGILKLAQPKQFLGQLDDYSLMPRALLPVAAAAVIASEIAAAVLTLVPSTHKAGSLLIVGLLAVFTAVAIRGLSGQQRTLRCACFGRASKRLTWSVPLRNAMLGAGALAGWFVGAHSPTIAGIASLLLLLCLATVVLEAFELFYLAARRANV